MGIWSILAPAPAGISTMLLLTDGTVMAHQPSSPHWWRLAPDIWGDYALGNWAPLAALPDLPDAPFAPLYFASAVMRDGGVLVAGGEDIVLKAFRFAEVAWMGNSLQ